MPWSRGGMVCLGVENGWCALEQRVGGMPWTMMCLVMPWSRTRMVCLKTEGGCEREVCLGVGWGWCTLKLRVDVRERCALE